MKLQEIIDIMQQEIVPYSHDDNWYTPKKKAKKQKKSKKTEDPLPHNNFDPSNYNIS